MNKTELIEQIAAGAGLTKVDAKKALDATVAAIIDALKKGDKVQGHQPRYQGEDHDCCQEGC